MPDPEADGRLVAEVSAFAEELTALVAGVFPGKPQPFAARVAEGGAATLVIIEQQPATGLVLIADGQPLLRLVATFRCAWDHMGEYLAVKESAFAVYPTDKDEPLFRYDYLAACDGLVPGAHLNVHGHRDEMVFALTAAGRRMRGKSRAAKVDQGRVPRLSTFHFPLGGPRFRPSLEDVVEIVVREFGLDTVPGWESVIRAGRASWRKKQLQSAVRDDAETAADTLRHLGYQVTWPGTTPVRERRDERVHAL